jgi:hypothetical protein
MLLVKLQSLAHLSSFGELIAIIGMSIDVETEPIEIGDVPKLSEIVLPFFVDENDRFAIV